MPPRSVYRTAARSKAAWLTLLAAVGLGSVVVAEAPARSVRHATRATTTAPRAPRGPARRMPSLPEGLRTQEVPVAGGVRVVSLPGGVRAELTVDPGLEAHVLDQLARYEVPEAGLVAIDPRDGRLLAQVGVDRARPSHDPTRDASAPAASVFKIITGAALLDAGVPAGRSVCYGGGLHGLTARDLDDDPARDTRCATLAEAMGGSVNAVFAKLADRHLDAPTLTRYADAFGFAQALPSSLAPRPSAIDVPTGRLEFARTAAGFWHSHLSPVHGALVAATVARGGSMPRVRVVARYLLPDGTEVPGDGAGTHRQVIGRGTAEGLARMMERTVASGTAHRSFFDEQGRPFLPGIRVAGKTGTLTAERPSYRGYTWFVGFAPADHPRIAVAALVVNQPEWRIKASYLAREALRYWLVARPAARR